MIAGVNEGRPIDRTISIIGLILTATPEFVTGIFLILIFGIWLKVVPAVAIFTTPNAVFENPSLLVLPVMTLTAVELGYVARMTRASMVEVMDTPYIRAAIIKGMPRRRVIFRHAVRNALLAPITIKMCIRDRSAEHRESRRPSHSPPPGDGQHRCAGAPLRVSGAHFAPLVRR